MTPKNKASKINVRLFQVFAVLFLIAAVYLMCVSWNTLQLQMDSSGISFSDVADTVIASVLSTGAPYVGFSLLFYGIACLLDGAVSPKKESASAGESENTDDFQKEDPESGNENPAEENAPVATESCAQANMRSDRFSIVLPQSAEAVKEQETFPEETAGESE